MVGGAENLLHEDFVRSQVLHDFSSKVQKEVQLQHISNRSKIFELVKNFEADGTCLDHRVTGFSPSGPPMIIRTFNNITRAQESVGRTPNKPLQRRNQGFGISVSFVEHILNEDLELYSYWIQITKQ